ncbi:hypothetical protein Tco_1307943, partial [Tanacetum coccineum]
MNFLLNNKLCISTSSAISKIAVSNQSTDEEQLADRDKMVLLDQWSVLVSEWSSENGKNNQYVNEETAALI